MFCVTLVCVSSFAAHLIKLLWSARQSVIGWPVWDGHLVISLCVLDLNIHQHLSVSTFSFMVILVRVCVLDLNSHHQHLSVSTFYFILRNNVHACECPMWCWCWQRWSWCMVMSWGSATWGSCTRPGLGWAMSSRSLTVSFGLALHTSYSSSSSLSPSPSLRYKAGQPAGWVSGTGFARSLKVWGKWDTLFKALKVCEKWVGSVKVCEFCGLQSAREELSVYQSETAFPETKQ